MGYTVTYTYRSGSTSDTNLFYTINGVEQDIATRPSGNTHTYENVTKVRIYNDDDQLSVTINGEVVYDEWAGEYEFDLTGDTSIEFNGTANYIITMETSANDEDWLIKKSTLTAIADAIREKSGSSDTIQVSELASEIENLPSGSGGVNPEVINRTLTEITADDLKGVTAIPSRLFASYATLEKITIPDSVTSIGSYAFYDCIGLTSITIPDSVTSLGASAFYGCSNLPSITIPDSVTSIGSATLYNCSKLTSVTIGNSVTSIGEQAFYKCGKLPSITIPDSVTSIGGYAFRECRKLWSINIPNGVTSIGAYTFTTCSALSNITIPNSVASIGTYAFAGSGLSSITIPSSVTMIDSLAFSDCHLGEVTCLATTPPTLKSNVFARGLLSSCVIKVPAESVSAYKSATNWADLSSRIQAI